MTVQELINILDEELNKIKSEDRPVFVQNIFTGENERNKNSNTR